MKKILSVATLIAAMVLTVGINQVTAAQQQSYKVTPKAPYVSPALKPIIDVYRRGDYSGAMTDIEALLKKEPNNTTAKYYLALCYTRLGYRAEAEGIYNEIINLNSNMTLVHYSKLALACIDNPTADGCRPKSEVISKKSTSDEEEGSNKNDIEDFINSGSKFHPAVVDRFNKDRMERQLQEEEYQKKLNPNLKSEAPTNEEIAAALNTLSKIGMNPFDNSYAMVNNLIANPYQYSNPMSYSSMLNTNPELAKLIMYNQLNNQITQQFSMMNQNQNNINTFGF